MAGRWEAHTVPVWVIRRLIRPTVGKNWAARMELMESDPIEARRIADLADEVSVRGFERPVLVEWDRWWDPRPSVSDGEHRCLAAMGLGCPVPIRFRRSPFDDAYDHSDVYRVTSSETPVDDLLDAVMSAASFRSCAGPWIQTDTASSGPEGVEVYLPRFDELRSTIADELSRRLLGFGVRAEVRFLENRELEVS